MELLATVGELAGGALTLAKEVGKGGGGSTEEPTVCMVLLPVALGVLLAMLGDLRRRLARAAQA